MNVSNVKRGSSKQVAAPGLGKSAAVKTTTTSDSVPVKKADGFQTVPAGQGVTLPVAQGARPEGTASPMGVRLGMTTEKKASLLLLDASHPDIQAFAASKGWNTPGFTTDLYAADLVYTVDNWKTAAATLQFMRNNVDKGFVLQDVPPGGKIEYAVHAYVAQTYKNHQSTADRGDFWLNNGGANFQAATVEPR